MTQISIFDIRQELINRLRNADLFSIATRGVTAVVDESHTATLTGAETFTMTNSNVKNVRSVSVEGAEITYGDDYTLDLNANTFTIASVTLDDAILITYDYGTNDRLFPDFPQPHLKIGDFPRIGFDTIAGKTDEIALGGGSTQTSYTVSVVAYNPNQDHLEELIASIRSFFIKNKKSFYYFNFITPTAMGPVLVSPFGNNKIFQRNQDFEIPFVYEDTL